MPNLAFSRTQLFEGESHLCAGRQIHPPFHLLGGFLQQYLKIKAADPHTSACFLVPGWYNTPWRAHLAGMTLLHTFPAGTAVFCGQHTKTPTPWPVEIWYNTPHQPIKLTSAAADKRPTMMFEGHANGAPAAFLVDSGASDSFADLGFARQHGLALVPTVRAVEVADGHSVVCRHKCKVHMRIQSYRTTRWVYLVDLGVDVQVILGDDWLTSEPVDLLFSNRTCVVRGRHAGHTHVLQPLSAVEPDESTPTVDPDPDPVRINTIQLKRHLRRGHKVYVVHVVDDGVTPLAKEIVAASSDCSPEMQALLQEYTDVFEEIQGLPPERPDMVHHVIPLKPGTQPHCRPMKRYSPAEVKVMEEEVTKLLKKGLIEPSTSPWGASIVFAQKPDGSLRFCVDWRVLNRSCERDALSLPLTDQLFDQLSGAQYLTSLDLQSGYFQLSIVPEDRPKTAFQTPFGHYQFKVLGQGLTNAPSVFMRAMQNMFRKQLGKTVFIFLDDILIASKTHEEHIQHVREALQVLRDNKFYAKLSKCEFEKPELKFLGHYVGRNGLRPDPKKTQVVEQWPTPQSVTEVRSFLGLANYFRRRRRYIQGFSKMAGPLTSLTKQDVVWNQDTWTPACQRAFDAVKQALTTAPTLRLPDFAKPFELVADASITAVGAVLLQEGHPVAYYSRKLTPAEVDYHTTDQELLAVMDALAAWRCYLEGGPYNFTIVSDHHPLIYLQTQPDLSRRQARWVEILQRYNFDWVYRPGRQNVADPLSRVVPLARMQLHLFAVITRRQAGKAQAGTAPAASPLPPAPTLPLPPTRKRRRDAPDTVPAPQGTANPGVPLVLAPPAPGPSSSAGNSPGDLLSQLTAAYEQDPWFAVPANTANLRHHDGVWWRGACIAIPNHDGLRQGILYELHDAPYSGHPGRDKTLASVQSRYWWPGLPAYVKQYVAACSKCQQNKASQQKPAGLLQPLPIPEYPWDSVSYDLITQLPKTARGHTAVLTVVCRLSKMVHFLPTHDTLTAMGLAQLYRDHVWKLHGVPKEIISDRGTQFNN